MTSLADSNVRPHDRFFFSDDSLYLVVENSLYCVHKSLFEIHAPMFPVGDLETSRNKPYVLGDVKKSDFDCLLAHLYPRTLGVEETETTQDWISVLGLASKWGFNSLRSRAISKIEQTLESPIDMIILGRQYGIPDVLLPGYAVLCQSTIPLSYEEGLRLGMEDVVNIYRIRHELYNSGITPVPLEVAFAKVKEASLGAKRPRQELDSEHASTWMDVGSVAASQTSAEQAERGAITLTPKVDSSPLDVASTEAATLMSKTPKQRHIDGHLPSDDSTSVALGNEGSNVSSSFPGDVSDLGLGSLEPAREGLDLVEELAKGDLNMVSDDIVQWINTKDIQTLHQITRVIVEKAIEAPSESDPCARVCRAMMKYTQTWHQMTRSIVEKAMEGPHRISACAQLCSMMMNALNSDHDDRVMFSQCLGEICQENLETIAASVAAAVAGELMARVRRWRLIQFIGALIAHNALGMWEPTFIDKWVTALLDANDEEKVATLCMAMTCVGRLHTSLDDNSWLQRVKDVAQETSKPRVQKLLQGMNVTPNIHTYNLYDVTWVFRPSEECTV